jgi:DNA-binding NarL/FixJ family response regulator
MTERIRVVIADDKELMRKGLAVLLDRASDMECVGQASDGQQAVELADRLRPDIISMDINMPRLNGLQATAQICARHTNARVLIVAMSYDEDLVRRAIEYGARGYIAKADLHSELLPAIRAVHAGETYFSTAIKPFLDGNHPD